MIPSGGPCIWIEVKILTGNILRPSARQYIELNRLWRPPHCYAFLLGWKDGAMYITPPIEAIDARACHMRAKNQSLTEYLTSTLKKESING
jgi:hypothetical protein